jgi:hypothetical protein
MGVKRLLFHRGKMGKLQMLRKIFGPKKYEVCEQLTWSFIVETVKSRRLKIRWTYSYDGTDKD